MMYFRSAKFHFGIENWCTNNIGGYGRQMSVASKLVSNVEANNILKRNVLSEKVQQNSALKMREEILFPRAEMHIAGLVEDEMKDLFKDIRQEVTSRTQNLELQAMANFYVDGKGKAIRPLMATLMGKSLNFHITNGRRTSLTPCQRRVAMATEMTHAASLMHDDLLDGEELRRAKPSMVSFNYQKVARAGDFLSGTISSIIELIKNHDARMILYKMSRDLALGEFLQLDPVRSENVDMFSRYLKVIHLKAAILFSSSCEAEAVLAGADYFLREAALQYGRNIGMAFQLADDIKDFESDLAQGVVTAPVLLACKAHRELEVIILRQFSERGDLERTYDLVHKARGLEETTNLVQRYCNEGLRHVRPIRKSPYQEGLSYISEMILNLIRV